MNKMKRTGTLEEVMSGIFELYVEHGASDISTREFLRNLGAFTPTGIFHLMELLQVAKSKRI